MFEQFMTLSKVVISNVEKVDKSHIFTFTNEENFSMAVTVQADMELTPFLLEKYISVGLIKIKTITFRED